MDARTVCAPGYHSDSSRSALEWDRRTVRGRRPAQLLLSSPRCRRRVTFSAAGRAGPVGPGPARHLLCHRLPPPPPTAHHAAGDGAAWRTTTRCAVAFFWHHPRPPMRPGMVPHGRNQLRWVRSFPSHPHTLSGRRRALPTSHWSWAVCRDALGALDCWPVSPLPASGAFSGACQAGTAVDGSPSAQFCRWDRRRCAGPCLGAVCWAGTVVPDRQRRAAATAAGIPGRAQSVSSPETSEVA
jgi:hypothetical protein